MGAAHRCHVADCAAVATDRCFECGVWCCDRHRSAIHIPTYTVPFHETLCAACLQLHLGSPDRYGRIVVEQPAPIAGGMDVAGTELGAPTSAVR